MDSMTDHETSAETRVTEPPTGQAPVTEPSTFEWLPPSPPAPPAPPAAAPRAGASGRRTVLVVAVVAAVVGAGVGAGVSQAFGGGGGQTVVESFSPNSSVVNERPADIQGILAKVLPSVVTIAAYSTSAGAVSPFPFGGGAPVQQKAEGTGMVITPGGEVVTNNHVISGASRITVTLNGSTRALTATVVGADPSDDVALLQIQGTSGSLPTVTFGKSGKVKVGDGVVAIGNALGLEGGPSVTAGIISAEDRGLTAQDPSTQQQITLTNMLQTDAAINPGNSGGPLVNSSGQVIGMNSDEATNAGDTTAQNIGFAIPSDKITSLLPLLRKGGTVTPARAYLGIQGGDVTPQFQAEFNLVPSQGALVEQVVSGTPAHSAGIQPGDVITSLDGNPINSWDDLTIALRSHQPGDRVGLGIYRGSSQLTITVTLGTAPTTTQ
jgi:S1-C subfamily serine protease